MKKVLIILGHPNNDSLCNALAEEYKAGAEEAGADVQYVRLADLQFDPILHRGYREIQELEPDLKRAQEQMSWAEHLVFVYPTWWGNLPALLKGFIDRTILPRFGFRFHRDNPLKWDKLLKGRSARIITTTGSPSMLFWLVYGYAGHNALKKVTLKFCGISPVKISMFGPAERASEAKYKKWFAKVRKLGTKCK